MADQVRRLARLYLKMLHSLYGLYRMLKVQLPPRSIRLESSMSALGVFFEELNECPDMEITPVISSKLRELRVKMEELTRLIFGVGMNDSDMVGDFMTGQTIELEEKIDQMITLKKELLRVATKEVINPAARQIIENEEAQIVWEQCFGSSRQVRLKAFYKKMVEIYGAALPCGLNSFKPFFGGDTVSLESFNTFVNITNANFVYAANDKVLIGNGRSVTNFVALQRKLGHLHAALERESETKPQDTPQRRGKPRRRIDKGNSLPVVSVNRTIFPPPPTSSSTSPDWEPEPKTDKWSWLRSKVKKWINLAAELSKYFHGNMERKVADELLHDDTPGTFLLRFGEDNNLCVSFVHVVPYKRDNGWKEWLMRKHITVHHNLNYSYVDGKKEPITWDEGLVHRRNINRHRTFRELQIFLSICGAIDHELSVPLDDMSL